MPIYVGGSHSWVFIRIIVDELMMGQRITEFVGYFSRSGNTIKENVLICLLGRHRCLISLLKMI